MEAFGEFLGSKEDIYKGVNRKNRRALVVVLGLKEGIERVV